MHLDFTSPAIDHVMCSLLCIQYAHACFYIHTFLMVQFASKVCYYRTVLDSAKLFFFLPKFPASPKMSLQLSFGLSRLHGEQDMVNWASQS